MRHRRVASDCYNVHCSLQCSNRINISIESKHSSNLQPLLLSQQSQRMGVGVTKQVSQNGLIC